MWILEVFLRKIKQIQSNLDWMKDVFIEFFVPWKFNWKQVFVNWTRFFFLGLFCVHLKRNKKNWKFLFMRAHRTQCRCLKRFSLCIIAIGLLPILIVYFLVSDQLYYRIKRTDVSIYWMPIPLTITVICTHTHNQFFTISVCVAF